MKPIRVAFIRGQYLNNYEIQSYSPLLEREDIEFTGFASLRQIHSVKVPTKRFLSPVDIPNIPYKLPILNRMFTDAMYLWGLEKGLRGYDIAHGRETYFHFSKQAVMAKKKGYVRKVLITCSETIPFNHETIKGRPELKKEVISGADHFHCLTHKAMKTLMEEGVQADKISVIPYGIDLDRFHPLQHPVSSDHLNFLFVGRLEEQKGIPELLAAWEEIKKTFSNVSLTIVGKGPLEKLVTKSGHDIKQYPYNQMPEVMRSADALILPSKPTKYWEEYFGMVLLEAMASGLPIVTTNCGAIPEVVWNAALVVDHSNAQSLYKGIRWLIERENMRLNMREKGLKRVKEFFDTKKQANMLAQLYKDLATS